MIGAEDGEAGRAARTPRRRAAAAAAAPGRPARTPSRDQAAAAPRSSGRRRAGVALGGRWWSQTRVSSLVPNRPGRPHEQHDDHHDVRHHVAEAAAEEGDLVLVAGGHGLRDADEQTAHRAAPPVESRPPRIGGRERQGHGGHEPASRRGSAQPARKRPATAASMPAIDPGDHRDPAAVGCPSGGGLAVLGGRAHRDPPVGVLEGQEERPDQHGGHDDRPGRGSAMPTPPTERPRPPQGWPRLRMSEPIRRVSSVSRMMSTPMVRMARLMTGAPRSRLISSRSTRISSRRGHRRCREHSAARSRRRRGSGAIEVGPEQQQRARA